eukprot:m.26305 g.26305  ORF g.26305 m.26305 type:complete len:73 (+) comp29225_c0_seq1:268-486(+)
MLCTHSLQEKDLIFTLDSNLTLRGGNTLLPYGQVISLCDGDDEFVIKNLNLSCPFQANKPIILRGKIATLLF